MALTDTAPPLSWDGTSLRVLDQTRLPGEEVVLTLSGADDTAAAISRLAVRGAPLIGVAAGYGLAMEVARTPTPAALERGRRACSPAPGRPRATSAGRWSACLAAAIAAPPTASPPAARAAAEAIHREDEAASAALARHGADALEAVLPDGPVALMTHCNSGALAASGRGTGLGVIAELADRRAGARARLRGAAAAAGRAADRVGAAPARDRPRAARRRRRRRA